MKNIYRNLPFVFLPFILFAQTERWVYRYNGLSNSVDDANSIIYGSDGNIYAAGCSYSVGSYLDMLFTSISALGQERWVYTYDDPGATWENALSLVYNIDGNLYATGVCSYGSGTYSDLLCISLTASGQERWVYKYNGPGNAEDEAYAIVNDMNGNIYIAGHSYDSITNYDVIVISLTPLGKERWIYRYDGGINHNDDAKAIVYGLDSNIYVAGASFGSGSNFDFTVISVTQPGQERWVYHYNGSADYLDEAVSLVYGSDNNIYVAGRCNNAGSNFDFTVLSLTTTGQERWIYHYDGPGGAEDAASTITYGLDGNVYAAGYSCGVGSSGDFTIISLTPSGQERWIYRYNGQNNSIDYANSIVFGLDGNIYAVGAINSGSTITDFIVISLTPDGTERWVYAYNGPGNGEDVAKSIVFGSDGNVYSAGCSYGNGSGPDFIIISLDPATGIDECQSKPKSEDVFEILSPFFNNKISIRFANASNSPLKIILYNVLGTVLYERSFHSTPSVMCLNDKIISELSKGVYFLSICRGDRNHSTTKLLKF